MQLDGGDKVAGAAIMQEEDPLSTPQRRATELPAARVALADAVAERAHGMQREVAERLEGDFALAGEARFRGGLIDDVTGLAADVLENPEAVCCRGGGWGRRRGVRQAHERREVHDIRREGRRRAVAG